MKIELNTEKSSFCIIGSYSFTFGQTEYDVDPETLSPDLRKQFIYNLRRGVLLTKEAGALERLLEDEVQIEAPATPAQQPQVLQPILSDSQRIEEDLKQLRKTLAGNIASVKAEAVNFRVARLRKLLELEKEGKARKSLISFLSELLDQHSSSVLSAVGSEDIGDSHQVDPQATSTQITDIVESEGEEISFSLDDVQESEEGELVLTQDILNQVGD